MKKKHIKSIYILIAILLLSACAVIPKKPDLALLYRNSYLNENATPIIIIPGLMGSSLENSEGLEVWPGSVSNLAFSSYAELADYTKDDYRPGHLIDSLVGVDFYGTLLNTLEKSGGYQKTIKGSPVINKEKRRYYIFIYDWRKSNFDTVNKLHELIEQIRLDYNNSDLKVDIIAHSNGGLIARYYLQYGPQSDESRIQPEQWQDGQNRIRRLAMLGTPNLGSVISVQRLYKGFEFGIRTIPDYLMAQYATPFEALPTPGTNVFIDANGTPQALNIYDASVWQQNKWSVFSDKTVKAIRAEYDDPELAIKNIQTGFKKHLKQAFDFQNALSKPLGTSSTQIALYGGDCELTLARSVVNNNAGLINLAFDHSEIVRKQKNVDYRYLLMAPGDGLVTRDSELARASNIYINHGQQQDLFAISQTTFFCEKHSLLTANPYFQNNLLYFILH